MARMVPDRPATTSSAAEVAVFERIRDELTAEWIALHSVGMTIHDSKPWAEIDFVLIGPPGVFCLEVKGGVIAREGGVWYTTPQHGANAGRRQPLKEFALPAGRLCVSAVVPFPRNPVEQVDQLDHRVCRGHP